MKKLSLTLLFYCILGCLFYSCCKSSHRLVGSSEFIIFGAPLNDTTGLHVISEPFHIIEFHELEIASTVLSDFGTQEAFATQPCGLNLINTLVLDELELYFDQELTIGNITVPASSNILGDSTFRQHIDLNHDAESGSSSLTVSFDSIFFNPPIFTNGLMNIRMVTRTDNSVSFESEIDVIVDF